MTHRSARPYDAAAVMLGIGALGVLAVACTVGVVAIQTIRGVWRFSDAVHGWRKRRGHLR